MNREDGCTAGDVLGRLVWPAGIAWNQAVVPSNDMPVHRVEFSRGFAIAKTELTTDQYRPFLDEAPNRNAPWNWGMFDDPGYPVTSPTYIQAQSFCSWFSRKCGRAARLPTGAEWEAAVRAGTLTEYWWGDGRRAGSAPRVYRHVAESAPNPWGIHDLDGVILEWVADALPSDGYKNAPSDGGTFSGCPLLHGQRVRVVRGGNLNRPPLVDYRSTTRWGATEDYRAHSIGFRPAFTPPDR